MKVFHGTEEYRDFLRNTGSGKGTAVALGKFDGIHLGHAKLIDAMIEEAGKRGLNTLLFTFDKPFASYFTGEKPEVLTTNKEREEAVREWGIDHLLEYPLRSDTVSVSPEDFVDKVLIEGINTKFIAAGPDMSYGSGGKGNITSLRESSRGRFEVLEVEKVRLKGETVSSTLVRDRLKKGEMEEVRELLSRPYSVSGKVSHGRKLGASILNMPTVNIMPEEYKLLPPFGVYFSETVVGSERFKSITNIGIKPTVQEMGQVNCETFLYGFAEDLYGENIRVELLHFLREEKKFNSMEDLKKAMHDDMLSGEEYFNITADMED